MNKVAVFFSLMWAWNLTGALGFEKMRGVILNSPKSSLLITVSLSNRCTMRGRSILVTEMSKVSFQTGFFPAEFLTVVSWEEMAMP